MIGPLDHHLGCSRCSVKGNGDEIKIADYFLMPNNSNTFLLVNLILKKDYAIVLLSINSGK